MIVNTSMQGLIALLLACTAGPVAARPVAQLHDGAQSERVLAGCQARAQAIQDNWAKRSIDRFARDRLAIDERERCDRELAALAQARERALQLERARVARAPVPRGGSRSATR